MNLAEAKEKVRAVLNEKQKDEEYKILENKIVETDHAWYIPCRGNRPTYIAGTTIYSSFGYIVGKKRGDLHIPGTAYRIENWLLSYELGLLGGPYDLIITKVKNKELAKQYLQKLTLKYHIPELENGTTWRIPKTFTAEMIQERLQVLPCQFMNQHFHGNFEDFSEINRLQIFEYQLVKNTTSPKNEFGETIT